MSNWCGINAWSENQEHLTFVSANRCDGCNFVKPSHDELAFQWRRNESLRFPFAHLLGYDPLKLGYNTSGLSLHDPLEAIELLAETGYQSIGLTINHGLLNPRDSNANVQLEQVKAKLAEHQLDSVIETSSPFLLSPRYRNFPTLMDSDPTLVEQRIEFLKYCVETAAYLESNCITIRSGMRPREFDFQQAMDRLAKSLQQIIEFAGERDVQVAFEPEPGMLVDTTGRFERLLHLLDSDQLKLTLNIGHLFCLSEVPISGYIEKWAKHLANIHISDMQAGVHEHLKFGEGQIYFPPVIESLVEYGYQSGIHVELERQSDNAADVIQESFDFLNPIIQDAQSSH